MLFKRDITLDINNCEIKEDDISSTFNYVLSGCPAPPPHIIKILTISQYQNLSQYKVFIETGTYLGRTSIAASKFFTSCHTIELSKQFYENNLKKFSKFKNLTAHLGSSDIIIQNILKNTNEPAVVWLDAHFSGDETAGEGSDPLRSELLTLLQYKSLNHIILIDDARGLGVSDTELKSIIKDFGDHYHASLLNDIVRIVPSTFPIIGTKL